MVGEAGAGEEYVDAVVIHDVPARLFLESQDHQHDLIKELRLIDLGDRFELAETRMPAELSALIGDILDNYADVRAATRQQVIAAVERGEDTVTLHVPVRPGVKDALVEWLRLLDEADRLCQQGDLLTLASRPEVRELRHWYVDQIVRQLGAD